MTVHWEEMREGRGEGRRGKAKSRIPMEVTRKGGNTPKEMRNETVRTSTMEEKC